MDVRVIRWVTRTRDEGLIDSTNSNEAFGLGQPDACLGACQMVKDEGLCRVSQKVRAQLRQVRKGEGKIELLVSGPWPGGALGG